MLGMWLISISCNEYCDPKTTLLYYSDHYCFINIIWILYLKIKINTQWTFRKKFNITCEDIPAMDLQEGKAYNTVRRYDRCCKRAIWRG